MGSPDGDLIPVERDRPPAPGGATGSALPPRARRPPRRRRIIAIAFTQHSLCGVPCGGLAPIDDDAIAEEGDATLPRLIALDEY